MKYLVIYYMSEPTEFYFRCCKGTCLGHSIIKSSYRTVFEECATKQGAIVLAREKKGSIVEAFEFDIKKEK